MDRIMDDDKAAVILPMTKTGRLPLDIIMTTPHKNYEDAVANGAKRYFTGKPCRRGHLSDRYTSTRNCIECLHEGGEGDPRPIKPGATLPICLGPGKVDLSHCVKCERMHNGCEGVRAGTKLRRAQLAFPNHEPVRRVTALQYKALVFRPAEPCKTCGEHSWRHVQTYDCAVCVRRELDAQYTTPPEQMAALLAARDARIATYGHEEDAPHNAKIDDALRAAREREYEARRKAGL